MKMEGLRRAYGIAEPVRRGMELKIVRDGTFRPAVLGGMRGGNVHEDILTIGGRDAEVQWEDIYTGMLMRALGVGRLANLFQVMISVNRLPSMTRWRRGSRWTSRCLMIWCSYVWFFSACSTSLTLMSLPILLPDIE